LALQNKLDVVERKVEIQEAVLKRLNRERDMAVSQLGVAYLESQDLKNEIEDLRQENAELKSQLAKLSPYVSQRRGETQQSEQTSASEASTDSEGNTKQSNNVTRGTKELTGKSTRSKAGYREDSRGKIFTQVDNEISRLEKERADEALFSISMPRLKEHSSSSTGRSGQRTQAKRSNTGKQRVKRVVVEEVDVTEPVESTVDATGNSKKSYGTEQDVTLLSFVDVSRLFYSHSIEQSLPINLGA
jgi:chromosome segregation ATPase